MVRTASFLLGLCLAILWLAGISSAAPRWFSWLDALAALCAFIGALTAATATPAIRLAGPAALSAGLFGLWSAGLAARVPPWQAWWTFVFAVAFAMLAVSVAVNQRRAMRRPV